MGLEPELSDSCGFMDLDQKREQPRGELENFHLFWLVDCRQHAEQNTRVLPFCGLPRAKRRRTKLLHGQQRARPDNLEGFPAIHGLSRAVASQLQGAASPIPATPSFSAKVSILLVEDFAHYRAYIAALLQSHPQFNVVDEASEGLEAVEKARQWKPDVILMDIGLPRLNGIEAVRQIREVSPHSRVVFLSQDTSPELVAEAIKLGGFGYVFKTEAEKNLLVAINAALEGKPFFSGRR